MPSLTYNARSTLVDLVLFAIESRYSHEAHLEVGLDGAREGADRSRERGHVVLAGHCEQQRVDASHGGQVDCDAELSAQRVQCGVLTRDGDGG